MSTRNTVQRTMILNAVNRLDTHPTADEIYSEVLTICPGISKGTVYRNLSQLADDGKLLRVAVANAPDRFDHTIAEHCHFLCLSCGRVYDYDTMSKIEINNELNPGFMVTNYNLIFNGFCKNCSSS